MKKIFALAIAIVMALALAVPAFALTELDESPVQVGIVKVDAGSIVIDGVKDAAYDATQAIFVNEQNLDSWDESPADTNANMWVVWDGAYIYIYAECADDEIWVGHDGSDTSDYWDGDHLGIMFDWDYNRTIEYEYSYDDNGDNVVYINITAIGDVNDFHGYHLVQEGMPYANLTSTKAIIDEDAGKIIYEAALPVPATYLEVYEGMKVGFEVGFTNGSIEGDDGEGDRVGNVTLSPFGSKMYKWTHVCSTATLLPAGESFYYVSANDDATVVEPEEPVVEPEEPAVEPDVEPEVPAVEPETPADPVAPSNPSTADVSVLFYALASLSAVAGLAISKRK